MIRNSCIKTETKRTIVPGTVMFHDASAFSITKVGFPGRGPNVVQLTTHLRGWLFDARSCREAAEFFTEVADVLDEMKGDNEL